MSFSNFNHILYFATLLVSITLLVGCGTVSDAPETATVKGTVTLDGKPLPEGNIVFDPIDGKGGSSAGVVKDGEFEFLSQFGSKRVSISDSRDSGIKGENGETVFESTIPEKFNNKSILTAEVKKAGENNFTFDLKK